MIRVACLTAALLLAPAASMAGAWAAFQFNCLEPAETSSLTLPNDLQPFDVKTPTARERVYVYALKHDASALWLFADKNETIHRCSVVVPGGDISDGDAMAAWAVRAIESGRYEPYGQATSHAPAALRSDVTRRPALEITYVPKLTAEGAWLSVEIIAKEAS